jgi:hypothetical protein
LRARRGRRPSVVVERRAGGNRRANRRLPPTPHQVPKVLASRFHATTRGGGDPSPDAPAAKRARRTGPSPCGGGGGGGGGDGALRVYRTFATQQAAFDFWDAQAASAAAELRCFAVEHDASGRRSFIVAAPERFWAEYAALPHAQRNHYEVRGGGRRRGPLGWRGRGGGLPGGRGPKRPRGSSTPPGLLRSDPSRDPVAAASLMAQRSDHPRALPLPPVL